MNTLQQRPTSIQLILNTPDNRLEQLRPIFEWLVKKGYGKLASNHFIIDTNVRYEATQPEGVAFVAIQDDAFAKGFKMNCFCFNINV